MAGSSLGGGLADPAANSKAAEAPLVKRRRRPRVRAGQLGEGPEAEESHVLVPAPRRGGDGVGPHHEGTGLAPSDGVECLARGDPRGTVLVSGDGEQVTDRVRGGVRVLVQEPAH